MQRHPFNSPYSATHILLSVSLVSAIITCMWMTIFSSRLQIFLQVQVFQPFCKYTVEFVQMIICDLNGLDLFF